MYFLLRQSTAALLIYTPQWLNDTTRFWSYTDTYPAGIEARVVFGSSKPPDQYSFAFVPRNTEVLGLTDPIPTSSSNVPDISLLRPLFRIISSPVSTPKLSSSFNQVKGMVALLQSIYASFTLYRSSGGQVEQYGFAAPGLTVLPYAVMSALNLVANLLTPQYPTMYLVRSEVMEEAERRTGLSFPYVVGKVVDKSGTDNIVKEGWSEIAGSFKDDDEQLYVSSSEEEDEKIEMCDGSDQIIHVPACPRFRRTDDNRTSPLRHFIESPIRRRLVFPRYQRLARTQQVPIQPSLFSFSLSTFRQFLESHGSHESHESHLTAQYERITQSEIKISNSSQFLSTLIDRLSRGPELGIYEILLVTFTVCAEALFTLALSSFSGQQSTLAQRAWTVTWFLVSFIFGTAIFGARSKGYVDMKMSHLLLTTTARRFLDCFFMVFYGAPAIGGFVVVSQMLKAYGICYKFV